VKAGIAIEARDTLGTEEGQSSAPPPSSVASDVLAVSVAADGSVGLD
jgi:hypothetical protein